MLSDDAQRQTAAARRSDPKKKAPPAPWGSFPLSELVVLVALILLVGGIFVSPPRRNIMLGAGLVLGSLAGLELSVREHFAGYRSHTTVLSGAVGVAVIAGLFAAGLTPIVPLAAGVAAFAVAAWLFARAFKRRAGGVTFRVR